MVIVSSSLVNSTPFVLRRREEEDARTRIWLEHGDTVVIDGLAQEGVRSAFPVLAGTRTNFTFQPRAQHLPNFVQVLDSGACCHPALKVRPCWTSWLRFSQSERRCRDSQRTLFLHRSLLKGTRSLDWEYACSVRPGTPSNELFFR